MLDTEIHKQIIEQLPSDKLAIARGFLKIRLMLEGPTLEGTSGDLVFYDFFEIRWFLYGWHAMRCVMSYNDRRYRIWIANF